MTRHGEYAIAQHLVRAAAVLFLVPVLAAEAGAQRPLDLTGSWLDETGQDVVISQAGSRVALRTPAGQPFDGEISGRRIRLSHLLPVSENVPADLPVELRTVIVQGRVVNERRIEVTFIFPCYDRQTRRPCEPVRTERTFVRPAAEVTLLQVVGDELHEADTVMPAVQYVAEVRFLDVVPDRSTSEVTIQAGEAALTVKATRTGAEEGRVYRTAQFFLWPDDGGLGPPRPVIREPDERGGR